MPRNAATGLQAGASAPRRRVFIRRLRRAACALAALLAAGVFAADAYIERRARRRVFDSVDELPYRRAAIVLGTSRYAAAGGRNGYYTARIEAAADLYHRGKIGHIIASGANPSPYYNEPRFMKTDLIALGVPASKITADFAGLRTLDSVVRAHEVFGQDAFTVVSQRFHLLRAVYLGRSRGLNVVGYAAGDPAELIRLKARLREYGARAKALLDVWVLHTQPAVLGEKIALETGAESRRCRFCATD